MQCSLKSLLKTISLQKVLKELFIFPSLIKQKFILIYYYWSGFFCKFYYSCFYYVCTKQLLPIFTEIKILKKSFKLCKKYINISILQKDISTPLLRETWEENIMSLIIYKIKYNTYITSYCNMRCNVTQLYRWKFFWTCKRSKILLHSISWKKIFKI